MNEHRRGAVRHLLSVLSLTVLTVLAACGGSDGGPCTTCPPPPGDTGTLSVEVAYEPTGDLSPAGFVPGDVTRIDLLVVGPNGQSSQSLTGGANRAAFELAPGEYSVSATAFGTNDVVLFTDQTTATVQADMTRTVGLEMVAALGTVTLTIDGETGGTIQAVAGEGVPFTVTVRNNQNKPVPGSTVRLTPTAAGYGTVAFDSSTETNAQGQATGTIDAAFSGELSLTMEVDGRPVTINGPSRIVFATGVAASNSGITQTQQSGPTFNQSPVANGLSVFEYTVQVRNASGDPLPGVPVTPTSIRNTGVEPDVDLFEPAAGYESGVTDANGVFRFRVRTFTSSFFFLNAEGRLRSTDGTFVSDRIEVFADGVKVDERTIQWNSAVHPNLGGLNTSKQFVTANGQDFAVLIVNAQALSQVGGGPVANAYVEIVHNGTGDVLNEVLNITPEPGFDGFRTNAQGEWRGRIRSTTPGAVFFNAKVDGRTLVLPNARSVIFQ